MPRLLGILAAAVALFAAHIGLSLAAESGSIRGHKVGQKILSTDAYDVYAMPEMNANYVAQVLVMHKLGIDDTLPIVLKDKNGEVIRINNRAQANRGFYETLVKNSNLLTLYANKPSLAAIKFLHFADGYALPNRCDTCVEAHLAEGTMAGLLGIRNNPASIDVKKVPIDVAVFNPVIQEACVFRYNKKDYPNTSLTEACGENLDKLLAQNAEFAASTDLKSFLTCGSTKITIRLEAKQSGPLSPENAAFTGIVADTMQRLKTAKCNQYYPVHFKAYDGDKLAGAFEIDPQQPSKIGSIQTVGSHDKYAALIGADFTYEEPTFDQCNTAPISANKDACETVYVAGYRIGPIDPQGPAYRAGLRTGDVIDALYPGRDLRSAEYARGRPDNFSIHLSKLEKGELQDLFVRYSSPLESEEHSQHWKRAFLAKIQLDPQYSAGTLVDAKRVLSIESALAQRRESNVRYREMAGLDKPHILGQPHPEFAQYDVKPYQPNEIAWSDQNQAISKKPNCTANGTYPFIPKLTFPSGFRTSYDTSVTQTQIFGGTIDDDNSNDIDNFNRVRGRIKSTIGKARQAFWEKMDRGVYDENLKNEYAYWLALGRDLVSRLTSRGNNFSLILARKADETFDYPWTDPSRRDTYQFLKFSACSPTRSGFQPEKHAGTALLSLQEKSGSTEWHRTLELWADEKGNAPEITYNHLIEYMMRTSSLPFNAQSETREGVHACARRNLSAGQPIDPCFANVGFDYKILSQTSYAINMRSYTLAGVKRDVEMSASQNANCNAADAGKILEYFTLNEGAYRHLRKIGGKLVLDVCMTSRDDLFSDRLDEIVLGYIQDRSLRFREQDSTPFWGLQ